MKFTNTLLKGKLIRRYKRFFTDIEVNNKTVVAHCPNTGSMMGLLNEVYEVWISGNSDPKRKLKFTLEMIKVKKRTINNKNLIFFGIFYKSKHIGNLKFENIYKNSKNASWGILIGNKKYRGKGIGNEVLSGRT